MKLNMSEISNQKKLSDRYKKLYKMLLDAIPSSVLLIDRDMNITSVNKNFLEKSRRSLSNTIGHKLEEVFPPVILQHVNIPNQIHNVFEKNKPTMGERMTYRVPGIPISIYYYRIFPFSCEGMVESAMLLMEDVTEQIRLSGEVKQVEHYLASVVESASDIVLSADIEGRIRTWNSAAENISGYTFNDVKGKFFFDYLVGGYPKDPKIVISSLKTGNKSRMAEWNLITKHGNSIKVSWVLSPMKDYLFQTVGMVAVGRDLTERRKFEMQLIQSQKLASLGVMAGGIAHEIRNPLAICSSSAQFLMDNDITPEFRIECAKKINTGIHRASFIIENLLRFARPSESTEMADVNLISLFEETITLVANQARIHKIEIRKHFPDRLVLISGIASLIQQVFLNLFLNAFKAMSDGGTLSISMERTDDEVLVHVSDTGCGIPEEVIDNIFDPFYTNSPAGKGTGLGLSICYSIMNQHSGFIEVNSSKGKGSTFTLKFPIINII